MGVQDILLKALTRSLSGGALEVLGIAGVELAEAVPTELPANALYLDQVWRTQDGHLFHLEFQSTREPTLHRFLEYDARLARKYLTKVRTVVLYHGATVAAPAVLDIGTAQYRVENVFLSTMDADLGLNAVEEHIASGEWQPADRLRLALALAMRVKDLAQTLERVIALVAQVPGDEERDLVVSALSVFGDSA